MYISLTKRENNPDLAKQNEQYLKFSVIKFETNILNKNASIKTSARG